MKARRVFLFQRIKLADKKKSRSQTLRDEDGEDILENMNNTETEWKWYIIR